MYEKNFNFLFKSMFLEKMVELKKKKKNLICSSSPRKRSPIPYRSDSLQNFSNFSVPHLLINKKKKINKMGGGTENEA